MTRSVFIYRGWWCALMIFVAGASIEAIAQNQDIHVSGTVLGAITGEPLGGAMLRIKDEYAPNEPLQHATANAEGLFHLSFQSHPSKKGRYHIEFRHEGYETAMLIIDGSKVLKKEHPGSMWSFDVDMRLHHTGSLSDRETQCKYVPASRLFRCTGSQSRNIALVREWDQRYDIRQHLLDSLDAYDGLSLYGDVVEHWTSRHLPGVEITAEVLTGEDVEISASTNTWGVYACSLPYDRVYRLTYKADSLVSKTIVIDLLGIPEKVRGFSIHADIRLFAPLPGEDLSFLDEPLGWMRYDPKSKMLKWDQERGRSATEQLDAILLMHMPGSPRFE